MAEREQPMTQTMKASEAKQQWGQLLNQVFKREKRVLIEKSGIPVVGIVSAQDLERLQAFEAQREADFAVLDEIGEAFKDQTPEQIEREVARAVAAARTQMRREDQEGQRQPFAPPA